MKEDDGETAATPSTLTSHSLHTQTPPPTLLPPPPDMDAFTIAPALPIIVEEPVEIVFVDKEEGSGSGGHSECIVA